MNASIESALGNKKLQAARSAENSLAAPANSTLVQKPRVLVVEDNATNQQVASAMLQKLGCDVDIAHDGVEALGALRESVYEVVLMDCEMPGMDGYETTRRIRLPSTGVRNSAVPIIAMTARAMKGDRDRCIAAGMDDYLAKPIAQQEIKAALAKWIGREYTNIATTAVRAGSDRPADVIFDRSELLARLSGDEELAKKIVVGFTADVPLQLRRMDVLLAQGDLSVLAMQAHTLKGAASTVAARALRALSIQTEQAAMKRDAAEVEVFIKNLHDGFEQLLAELAALGWTSATRKE